MQTIYEANAFPLPRQDFDTLEAAKAFVEANTKEGSVVTFVKGFDGRDRSAAMNVYRNGTWDGVNIHE